MEEKVSKKKWCWKGKKRKNRRKVEDEGKEGKGGREGGRTKGRRIVRRKARRNMREKSRREKTIIVNDNVY